MQLAGSAVCGCVLSLTPAAVGAVVPVSGGALPAVRPVDSGPAGALTALRVARPDESRRGVAVALTAAGARVEAERAVLGNRTGSGGGPTGGGSPGLSVCQTLTTQRSQRGPVTPALQRHSPV